MKLLASQAAISLENTRLYRELAEREAKISCLVNSNVIGIFISRRDGSIIEANEAFLNVVGYDREDLTAGGVLLRELTAPEWVETSTRARKSVDRTGAAQPFEMEYLRKDGSRVPVLIGSVRLFDRQRDHAVTFVLDLTERKRAETRPERARTATKKYSWYWRTQTGWTPWVSSPHQSPMRSPSQFLGFLHNRPCSTALARQRAACRIEKARSSLERIVRDVDRASNVIGRVRALVKKAPGRRERSASTMRSVR